MIAPADLANAVVRIPRNVKARGDVSFQALLMASRYADQHEAVDVLLIQDALRAQPELVGDWLQHSEDKRTSSGWFLRKAGSGDWEVGHLDRGAFDQVSSFQDEVAACAVFIKKEIEDVRTSGS